MICGLQQENLDIIQLIAAGFCFLPVNVIQKVRRVQKGVRN